MTSLRRGQRIAIVLAVAAVAIGGVTLMDAVPQPPAYHQFADARALGPIPRAADVLSNLPFLIVGVLGLVWVSRPGAALLPRAERAIWATIALGITLTAFGSAWYHLAPDTPRLVLDRLPMTVVFTAFLTLIVAERVSMRAGAVLLPALVGVGIASVHYWEHTETLGRGDLRACGVVQFLPMVLVPVILALFPGSTPRGRDVCIVAIAYGAAKLLEWQDAAVFRTLGFVSGHTLKHLAAAGAAAWLLVMLRRRVAGL